MSLSEVDKLGRAIGSLSPEQDIIRQNISADEVAGQDQLSITASIEVQGALTINSYTYPTDSFIIDHMVYGEIDSAVLKLDGGYAPETFPIGFPIFFIGAGSLLYYTEF